MRSATRPLSLPHGSAAKRRCGATRWPPRASSRNSDGRCRAAGAKLIGPVGKRNPHVLIAGAGIGGLTAALALLKLGFDVDLYEQARELKEVGAGLNLSANGNRALHELGVLEDLKPLACNLAGKEVRLWNTGQTWKLFDLGAVSVERYGFPYLAAYRPDLLGVRRIHPGRRPGHAETQGRRRGERRCAHRRRRHALENTPGALRRRQAGVHRHHGLARHGAD